MAVYSKQALTAVAAVLALAVLAGCAPPVVITGHDASQLDSIGDVRLTTEFCTVPANGTSCGAFAPGNGSQSQVKVGYTIPAAAQAPAQFESVAGRSLTFTPDPAYTPEQAGVSVQAGRKWVGYSSQAFTYQGAAESIRIAPRFALPQGADGSPYSGGFGHSVNVRTWDQQGFTAPANAAGELQTRDLGVVAGQGSAAAGGAASVPFNLEYAGPAGAGPFELDASTDVAGAAAAPSAATLTPAADSDNEVTVDVTVPEDTAPGDYEVTLTASLANGQTRSGTATLTVSGPLPRVQQVTAGFRHTCALIRDGSVRCWGISDSGQLGQGNTENIGLTAQTLPDSVPPVDLGPGRTALQISAGIEHTCALLDDQSVLCWGSGAGGALGQGDQSNVGDDETPGSVGPVDLGGGHTAVAVAAGGSYSCAILDDASVKCWGAGTAGKLGYGNTNNVSDPTTVGPVPLGPGRSATALDAAADHTCAILTTGEAMCWGGNVAGKLGYGFNESTEQNIGDDETPDSVGTIDLGGHTALQVAGGDNHTCAILDDATVRCWGTGFRGINGYPGGEPVFSAPATPVDLGAGRTAAFIEGAADHTCAVLDDATVRCWGFGSDGRLGYGNTDDVGDNETPGSVGPVNLGPGRTAAAVSGGAFHTCALLDTGDVRCWGSGALLGYGNTTTIGDDETPDTAGPVSLGG